MDTKRKPPAHLSLSPTCSASSAGDTPLSLSGVPNKPCAWLTANTDSFNLSDSQLPCHQSAQSSPLHGRKRRHSGSANSSPEILAPVAKHARYELLPHQGLDDVSVSTEQPSKATAQVSNFSPRAPISPPQALTSPEAPTSPQPPVSPPQAPISSPEAPTSPQHPVPSPQAPISPPQAPTSPPQVTFSPQAPISPPRAPTSPPLAPISPQSAPFSPPLASEDLQSNCKRRRKSTYTLEESVCDEQCEMKEQDEEPPSKRVRRATFSVSPKVTKRSGNEIAGTDENAFANVQGDSAETLNGIMDVHSEIMDLLDKRVEIIRKSDMKKNYVHTQVARLSISSAA